MPLLTGAAALAPKAAFIEPGSPWQNPYVESLGGRLRDELLNQELFSPCWRRRCSQKDWRTDHNKNHPHSALGMLSPDEFAALWRQRGTTTATPTPWLSLRVDRRMGSGQETEQLYMSAPSQREATLPNVERHPRHRQPRPCHAPPGGCRINRSAVGGQGRDDAEQPHDGSRDVGRPRPQRGVLRRLGRQDRGGRRDTGCAHRIHRAREERPVGHDLRARHPIGRRPLSTRFTSETSSST